MIVVSNTSPITNLAAIHHLPLFKELYGQIWIPPAVFRELTEVQTPVPGTEAVQTLDWIQTRSVKNCLLV
ncbi:MAG: DUF3368 domain-containing protein, partial [Prochlorotrichaceae cyanobacterium]